MVVLVCFSGVGFGMIWGFGQHVQTQNLRPSPAQAPRESNKCGAACGSSSAASAEGTAVERFGIGWYWSKVWLPKNRSRSLPKWSKSAAPRPFNFDPIFFVFLLKLCDSVHLCDCPVQWFRGKPPQHGEGSQFQYSSRKIRMAHCPQVWHAPQDLWNHFF